MHKPCSKTLFAGVSWFFREGILEWLAVVVFLITIGLLVFSVLAGALSLLGG